MTTTLREIEERCEKATEGAWKVYDTPHKHFTELRIGTEWEHGQLKGPYPVVNQTVTIEGKILVAIRPNDAEFIAHSRTDIPYLLSLLKRCEGSVEKELEYVTEEVNILEGLEPTENNLHDLEFFRVRKAELEQLLSELGK
jgi:hypothetical protein